jgi:hypothetical protein
MSFSQAQQLWEQSWIQGPPDDPLEPYYDGLTVLTDAGLEEELRSLKLVLRHPEPGDRISMIERMVTACEVEIQEREKSSRYKAGE